MFQYFQIDLRALALMRICLGLVLLIDIFFRIPFAVAFYTDHGILPINMLKETIGNPLWFTFHNLHASTSFQYILLSIHAIAAIFLVLGIQTRISSLLCWLLLVSSHNRNPFILQGGDELLRMVLLLGIFIPWGKRYAINGHKGKGVNNVITQDWSVLTYALQIAFVYFFSALMKGPEWHTDFTAVYYVYQLKHLTYPIATWISRFPELLKALTACVFYVELLVPLFIFFPFKNHYFRLIACLVIIGFHLWNAMTINVGLFYAIGITSCIGLLPSFVMDEFDKWLTRFQLVKPQQETALVKDVSNSFISSIIWWLFIWYIAAWNVSNCSFVQYKMDKRLQVIAHPFRLDQNWGMFAPGVYKDDGWFVFEAETASGDTIDILRNGEAVSQNAPQEKDHLFKHDRWRKFGEHLKLMSYGYLREPFCKHIAREWNQVSANKIGKLRIVYWKQITLPDYKRSLPERDELYEIKITPPLSTPHQN